jgi:hypothetical protein
MTTTCSLWQVHDNHLSSLSGKWQSSVLSVRYMAITSFHCQVNDNYCTCPLWQVQYVTTTCPLCQVHENHLSSLSCTWQPPVPTEVHNSHLPSLLGTWQPPVSVVRDIKSSLASVRYSAATCLHCQVHASGQGTWQPPAVPARNITTTCPLSYVTANALSSRYMVATYPLWRVQVQVPLLRVMEYDNRLSFLSVI